MPLCCFGGSHRKKKKEEMTTTSDKVQVGTTTLQAPVGTFNASSPNIPEVPRQKTARDLLIEEILAELESSTETGSEMRGAGSKPLAELLTLCDADKKLVAKVRDEKEKAMKDEDVCYENLTNTSSSLFIPYRRAVTERLLAQKRESQSNAAEREETLDKEGHLGEQVTASVTATEAEGNGTAATSNGSAMTARAVAMDETDQRSAAANEAPGVASDAVSSSTGDDAIGVEARAGELKVIDIHCPKWGGRDDDKVQDNDERIPDVDGDTGGASTCLRDDDDEPSFVEDGDGDKEKVAYGVGEETVETIASAGASMEATGVTEMSQKTEHAIALDNEEKDLSTVAIAVAALDIHEEGEEQLVAERESSAVAVADIRLAEETDIHLAEETDIDLTGVANEEEVTRCTAFLTNIDAELVAEESTLEVGDVLCHLEIDECVEHLQEVGDPPCQREVNELAEHLQEVVSECVTVEEAASAYAEEEEVVSEAALVKEGESVDEFADFDSSPSQVEEDDQHNHDNEKEKETNEESEHNTDYAVSENDDIWAHGWPIFGVPCLRPIWLSLTNGPHLAPVASVSSSVQDVREVRERPDAQGGDAQEQNSLEQDGIPSDSSAGWQNHVPVPIAHVHASAFRIPQPASEISPPLLLVPPLGLTPPVMDTSFLPILHTVPPLNMSPPALSTNQSRPFLEVTPSPVVRSRSQFCPTPRILQPPPPLILPLVQNLQRVGFGAHRVASFVPDTLSTMTPRLADQVTVLTTSTKTAQAPPFEARRLDGLETAGVPSVSEWSPLTVTQRFYSNPMNSARFIPPVGLDIPRF
eukprot:GEMP01010357.1.p1 GENE.GEMP01010357.1~~GEMP01010357.1.p1  ORF type:complete len:814 (+),score=209.95 GEMP01010357.1:75-2516(+)